MKDELGKNAVIRMAGSDGHEWSADASEAHLMAEDARRMGVRLKPIIQTVDPDGNAHEINPFDQDALKAAAERGDTRQILDAAQPDYFSADALKAGATRAAIGLVNPWDHIRGFATAALTVARGYAKGTVGLAIKALRGATYLGESAVNAFTGDDYHEVSNFVKKIDEGFNWAVDKITDYDLFEITGEYDGVEGAKEATGAVRNVAEMVANLKGVSALGKGMVASGSRQAAAHAATAGLFGASSYGEMASDPNGPGGARQQAAALVGAGTEAVMFGLLSPLKIAQETRASIAPFEQATRAEAARLMFT